MLVQSSNQFRGESTIVVNKCQRKGATQVQVPVVARACRDQDEAEGRIPNVSERDARVTGRVLNVIMKDLDPGR
jgi:hypothetical protein